MFAGKYIAQNAPFFNYSGSVYLSFILRGDEFISGSAKGKFKWQNNNETAYGSTAIQLPKDAFGGTGSIVNPSITGSEYVRHVYVTSQSWWRPTQYAGSSSFLGGGQILPYQTDYIATSSLSNQNPLYPEYMILSGSMIPTGSQGADADAISVHTTDYVTYPSAYSGSTVVPNQKFSGSIMPMGELFRLYWYSGSRREISKVTFTTTGSVGDGGLILNGMYFDINSGIDTNAYRFGVVSSSTTTHTIPSEAGRTTYTYTYDGETVTTQSISEGVRDLINTNAPRYSRRPYNNQL